MTALVTLRPGDCLDVMDAMPSDHYDAVITDPPYHLLSIVKRFGKIDAAPAQEGRDGGNARSSARFMGKDWDGGDIAFQPHTWAKALRILKPGGHLIAFNHSRTFHRMAVALEDAGFDFRETLYWVYGTGLPQNHPQDKALAKIIDDPAIIEQWEGWGTVLRPCVEPIALVRKPLAEKSIARQLMATGTGAINVEVTKIPNNDAPVPDGSPPLPGRYPGNLLHDGSPEVAARFPVAKDGLSASRFFYCAKANKDDRRGSNHPTVKPQALMEWLVRLCVPQGATVLDPFAGSGATAWAAAAQGVNCDLIERDPEYQADIACGIASLESETPKPHDPAADALPGQISLFVNEESKE